jgi:hypothetical protein
METVRYQAQHVLFTAGDEQDIAPQNIELQNIEPQEIELAEYRTAEC